MPVLLKIRTDDKSRDFLSMKSQGLKVGDQLTWGVVGAIEDYRSGGDVKFFREGGLSIGDHVIVRERQSEKKVFFVALLKVIDIIEDDETFEPEYEVVEVFEGSATFDALRASNPKLGEIPNFQKNAKGYMLRSFTPLPKAELNLILKAVRASMR